MDSASPIAKRTTGQPTVDSGMLFTRAMWTNKAGNPATRRRTLERGFAVDFGIGFDAGFDADSDCGFDRHRGYRDAHRRSYGEGRQPT